MFLGIKVDRISMPTLSEKGKAYMQGIDNMHVCFIQMGEQLVMDEFFYYDDGTEKSPLPNDAGLYQEILMDLNKKYFENEKEGI